MVDLGSKNEVALTQTIEHSARVDQARRMADEIRRGSKERADAADRIAAREVAKAIREEQEALRDAERGGTMALIRGVAERGVHMTGLVTDRGRFVVHFERKTKGPAVDHQTLASGPKELPDGAVEKRKKGQVSRQVSRYIVKEGRR